MRNRSTGIPGPDNDDIALLRERFRRSMIVERVGVCSPERQQAIWDGKMRHFGMSDKAQVHVHRRGIRNAHLSVMGWIALRFPGFPRRVKAGGRGTRTGGVDSCDIRFGDCIAYYRADQVTFCGALVLL